MENSLYQLHILENARKPYNKYVMEACTISVKSKNVSCSDDITLYLSLDDSNRVLKASFSGVSCALSTASASLCMKFFEGKTLNELRSVAPGNIYDLLGVPITPARSACALLPYQALSEILKKI